MSDVPCKYHAFEKSVKCIACENSALTARLAEAEAALKTEKDCRIHWQGLAYIGMRVIDKVLANRITLGEGTTEESMSVNARMAMDKYTFLFNENKELREAAKGGRDE